MKVKVATEKKRTARTRMPKTRKKRMLRTIPKNDKMTKYHHSTIMVTQ